MNKEKFDVKEYVEQTAELLGLNLSDQYLPGVIDNFTKITEIASLVTDFDLSENVEIAPVFKPLEIS